MKLKRAKTGSSCGYLRSVETNDKLDMAEALFFWFDFFSVFSFRITRTSVNTDVCGRSPEVRVNEVLLYSQYARLLSKLTATQFSMFDITPAHYYVTNITT